MIHLSYRKAVLATAILGCLVSGWTPARAEEAGARDYDRFDIRMGGGWVFGANTEVTLLGSHGVGTVVDFNKTLDGASDDSLFRVDGTWRWAKKHSLNFSWYDVNRNGLRTIDRDINFGDQTFPTGALIASNLNIDLYRLLYRYGVARTDQVDVDFGAGLYYGKIQMGLTAEADFGSVTAGTTKQTTLAAPLPTAGLLVNCKLTPRLSAIFSADFFYFAYNDWEGSDTDVQIGLEYRLAKNWTLGAAYDRFVLNLEGPVGEGHFKVDNAWNSLYSYLSFHW